MLAVVPGLDVVVSGPVALGAVAPGFACSVLASGVVFAVVLGLGGVVSCPVTPGVVALGLADSVLAPDVAPELDTDVSAPVAFGVDPVGLAGWALWSGEVFVAVVALGAVGGTLGPRDSPSRFKK